jgi:type IV secretion system protein VirD4
VRFWTSRLIASAVNTMVKPIRRVPVMPPEVIRTLPFGTALVLLRSAPLLVTDLRPWFDRKNAARIRQDRVEVEAALRRR